jgi:hypothetical protein
MTSATDNAMSQLVLILALIGPTGAESRGCADDCSDAVAEKETSPASPAAVDTVPHKKSCYLIGNSLTWDTVPAWMDGDVQWHVDCGKSLPFIHDVDVISNWVEMQPRAIFVIHTGWAHHEKRAQEYGKKDFLGTMQHSPAYINALLSTLKNKYPDREFRQTHAIDLLAKIAADIKAGKSPFKSVSDIHRDAIHVKLDSGRYLMHNCMRHALGQPRSAEHYAKLDPKVKAYLDTVLATLPKLSPRK